MRVFRANTFGKAHAGCYRRCGSLGRSAQGNEEFCRELIQIESAVFSLRIDHVVNPFLFPDGCHFF
jgi:hypothetical protein